MRIVVIPVVALLAAFVGLPALAEDGGTGPRDGATAPTDGGTMPDSGIAPRRIAETEFDATRLRVRRLAESISETDDLEVPLASLFAIDLEDEDAVKARIKELQRLLSGIDRDRPDLATINTSSTATTAYPRADLFAALQREALVSERKYLRLPFDTRRGHQEADAARRTHEREEEEAAARAREAEAEAKAAEAAQLKALEEAEQAKTESLKALKSRLASIARAKSQLADQSQRMAERQEAESKNNAAALKKVQDILQRESQTKPGPAAHALFGELRAELRTSVDVLRKALTVLNEDIPVPVLRTNTDSAPSDASSEEREVYQELDDALVAFDAYVEEVRGQRRTFRLQSVSAAYRRVQALADARVRLLVRLPREVRVEIVGLSEEGLREARLEADLLAVGARALPVIHGDTFKKAPSYLKDVTTLGRTFWTLSKVVLVLLFAFWLRRRGGVITAAIDRAIRPRLRSVLSLRRYAFAKRTISGYGPALLFLLTIHLVFWSLGAWGRIVIVDLIFTTVLWVSYYWLLRTWLDATIMWLAKKRRIHLDDDLSDRLHRSTTIVARTALIYGLLDSVAVRLLRRGVLFHFANIILVASAIAVLLIVVRWWRRSIASAYLTKWPEGRLAELVKSTQEKYYNLFVVMAALGYVLVSGLAAFGKQFILGFEQSRKALAFVFRKRLERRLDKRGDWGSAIGELPARLVESFTLEPLTDASLRVEHFPGLKKLERDIAIWRSRDSKGSFSLIGGSGYGKTTWLWRALSSVEAETRYLAVERRDATPQSLLEPLATALGLPPDATYETIVKSLNEGPPTVFALDDAHRLFFRTMGGCAALDTLMDLIEATGRNVFWICAFDRLAWRHIVAHRPTRIRFRAEHKLDDWPEEKLRELLMARVGASHIAHEFEDLVVAGESDKEGALVEASEGYTRLIWDYSDGCPRVALRFWLHSLVPVSQDRVRVRLFKEPDEGNLSNIPEETVFVYAAVANHGALTANEASQIVGYPEPICEAGLVRGVEAGILAEVRGRFELTVDWQRQIIRFLRARQAL